MISSLWIAKTGLDAQQFNVDVISNNLANVTTNGFKRQRAVFEDLLYQTVASARRADLSAHAVSHRACRSARGCAPVATARVFTQGNLQQIGDSLNVAINGRGFFQILLPDGNTAYTRDGSFQLDNHGQIVTSQRFHAAADHHHPARCAHHHHRRGRHRVGDAAGQLHAHAGRHHSARGLHQPRRACRRSARTCSWRPPRPVRRPARRSRHQRPGHRSIRASSRPPT